MIVYVERNGGGIIKGVYLVPQPGYAEEALDDSDASVIAFRATITVGRTLDQTKYSALVTKVNQALSANTTYLALANPNAAQMQAQLNALTQQVNAVLKRLTQQD